MDEQKEIVWHCTPKKCEKCGSIEIEQIETIHSCEHVKILRLLCCACGHEFIGLSYPIGGR